MKKRILSFVLTLTMIFTMAVVGISAAESTAVDGEHMSLEKTVFEYGENIMITTKNVGSNTDWVGIYPASDLPGGPASSQWFYANKATEKAFNLSRGDGPLMGQPLPAGEYILYYLYNDGYEIGQSVNITVKEEVIVNGGLISEVNNTIKTAAPLDVTPRTFDALVKLPTSFADRAGVIIGNYTDGGTSAISFEIQAGGVPRLYYQEGSTTWNHLFNEVDMRSDLSPVRLTLVQDPAANTITCYINGEAKQTVACADGLPAEIIPTQEQMIGGDFRGGNAQFFKGIIYKASLYSDALTADQVASGNGTGLIASYDFTTGADEHVDLSGNGYDLVGEMNIIQPPMTGLVGASKYHVTLP
ncbi:MAG: hypothetical protein IKI93_08270, partial [Clostridia bacterium]|nr:hypothetical protein [Clostridia bacterium]